jgi:Methyltransferase domain
MRVPAVWRSGWAVGPSGGRLIGRLLASLGHRVTAIDASPSMAALARGHADALPVCVADGTALPFPDETFDLVVAYMCRCSSTCARSARRASSAAGSASPAAVPPSGSVAPQAGRSRRKWHRQARPGRGGRAGRRREGRSAVEGGAAAGVACSASVASRIAVSSWVSVPAAQSSGVIRTSTSGSTP